MRLIAQVLGLALLLAGLVLTLSPLPFGGLIALLGAALLIANNSWVARLVRALRRRSAFVERLFQIMRHIVPRHWREDIDERDFEEFSNRPSGDDA